MPDNATFELIRWIVGVIAPLIAVLLGVFIGAGLTSRRERSSRRHRFVERQVEEFYSLLLGIRKEIQAKSELCLKISQAANTVWSELCGGKDPEQLEELGRSRFPKFKRIIEYNNRELAEDLLPSYRKMLGIFRDGLWLAEDSTRKHYCSLVEFVGIWDRWMDESLPGEVVQELDHNEECLAPFYVDLEEQLIKLRARLAQGDV